MKKIVQVRLREAGRIFFYNCENFKLAPGDYIIVKDDRGVDYGQVVSEPEELTVNRKFKEQPKRIIRLASAGDMDQIRKNVLRTKDAFKSCMAKISEKKMPMKLVKAEYSFDRSKLVFYFTAEGRIDFRDLVKELAAIFRTRIELRQIGVRDEAKLFGGFGCCGRNLCCAKFLKDFEPVTIQMAKEQNLPLNPEKISGICGRLMCCLGFEEKLYKNLSKGLPPVGKKIKLKDYAGKIVARNPIKGTIVVELEDNRQVEIDYFKERDKKKK